MLPVASCLLLTGLSGCESVERKFTRKPKTPRAAPTPIINFQDYMHAMNPVDRYRKHYLLFDYWNDELMDGLQAKPVNNKRLKLASKESLAELTTLKTLVADDLAPAFDPLLEVRSRIDRRLHAGHLSQGAANDIWRDLEAQSRTLHRDLFWRDVQDRLKSKPPTAAAPPDQEPAAQ